ncbi:MAG: phage tail assembly chaperone [Rhodobacteraceae bacterium]|nr:phage tail assembly chaperone [Paracoccaceae bacterium]
MSGLDWPGLMRAGMRGLGLRPEEFWRLTPAELALMLGEAAGTPPLTRVRLGELAAEWPDQVKGSDDDRGGRA